MAMKTRTLLVVFLCSIVLVSARDIGLKQCKQSIERVADGDIVTRSPFVFTDEDFTTTDDTNARYRGMQKFTERSNLLVGLEDYRVGNIELHPLTFLLPHHFDANVITVVIKGRGTLTFMRQDKRQTLLLERGDVLRVPSGTTAYGTNMENNDNFATVTFTVPAGVYGPGISEVFVGAGGINPESFLRTFSTEMLEAAYNTKKDSLDRLLGTQTQGFVLKATEEQIKALTDEGESGSEDGPFNILKKIPSRENQYGRLHEVNATDYKLLQDLDLALSYFDITQGSMVLPFYNSKATQIAYVVKGEGYTEMVVPHLSPDGQYQRVSTPLKSGMVVVSPPGHPLITVASENQNEHLEILAFYVNAKDNIKFPYAGENNVPSKLINVAQEMVFAIPATEVEAILSSQKELFFSKGPSNLPQGARAFI